MTEPEWRIRAGREGDRALLAAFTCADPKTAFEVEVERFVQGSVLDWALDARAADNDPRLLLVVTTVAGELIGVAAHERVELQGSSGPISATKLEVVALATAWQGRSFESGHRASDVLMSAAMADISSRNPARNAHVVAVVHGQNERSLSLVRRYGFTAEITNPDPAYRRLVTP